MRLANDRKLSLNELLDRYDSVELSRWMAYDQTIGLDDPHYDAALTQMLIYNTTQPKAKKLEEFLRRAKPTVRPNTDKDRQQLKFLQALHKQRHKDK